MPFGNWTPHEELSGDPGVIRLSASLLDRGDRHCRDFAALKARPKVWPRRRGPRRYAPWETFPLGLVMDALNLTEFGGMPAEDAIEKALGRARSAVHPGVAVWARHAFDAYLRAAEWVAEDLEVEGVAVRPEPLPRVVQAESAAELRVLTAWGRWYASADGTVREFRRLRVGRPGEPDAPSNDALAFVAAAGLRADGDVYRDLPVEVLPDDVAPERVRLVEVVLTGDVPPRVLVDAPPAEVRRVYRERTKPIVTDIAFGTGARPGSDCVDCKALPTCEAVPDVPGLLGLDGRGTHRRTWSVTTGRQYLVCPAQAHLRELHIPAAPRSDGTAARRGRAVHRWLEFAHGRPGAPACSEKDLPEPASGPGAGGLTPEEYADAYPYLVAHVDVCPLREPSADVLPEPSVAAHDTEADVVVIAHPDLVRTVDGTVVYREQKTTQGAPPAGDAATVFTLVPQLALAVLLMAHGVLGGDGGGIVELETMTPSGAEVLRFDVWDPAVRRAARETITSMTARWHADDAFAPTPGPWCGGCAVADWCPDRASNDPGAPIVVDGVRIDPLTGEVLGIAVTGRAAAVAEGVTDPSEEPPPF
ncbi:PD-(D/E)XK nuclease family protein [Actinomadura sp. LOL_016]|uniref:PD-(D/E)XK nuclease family protein n=1 Tax=unclassified Actinomadura TaxID=2626254 RepID=UPI003A80A6B1